MARLTTVPGAAALVAAAVNAFPAQAQGHPRTLLFDHVHITVPDPQAAARWYHEQFGGEWVDGDARDRLLFGTTRIAFVAGEGRRPSAGSTIDHIGFSFADLEGKLREVEAAGATITDPIREVEGLFRIAFLTDPWGVRIELVEEPQQLGFHHVHLASPDPEATLQWHQRLFGGVRLRMRGRLEGLLYPGNVWILVRRGEVFPASEGAVDHLGWRAADIDESLAHVTSAGAALSDPRRDINMTGGVVRIFFITNPDGGRVELVERQPDMR